MDLQPLTFDAPLERYQAQAWELLELYRAADPAGIRIFRHNYPRFLDDKVPWLPKKLSDAEVLSAGLEFPEAQLTLARWYDFANWDALEQYTAAVTAPGSTVHVFESAVEAVVGGHTAALDALLRRHPGLTAARSSRITKFDPAGHRATLLHYVAANGVEGYRQKTPPNAVEIARLLLEAGAKPDAFAWMYGAPHTTMVLLVSSCHPAQAGLQSPLAEALLDYGAAVDGPPGGKSSPLLTALAFGYLDTAETLVRRGARIDSLSAAAGLGRFDDARRLLGASDALDRHRALALAAQHGHTEVVRLLLDAGEDPDRLNPEGNHAHSTPLHQAVWANRGDVVRLLVERGARRDIGDTFWNATPLDWAVHGERTEIASYLRGVEDKHRS